jgi:hypothetical protein
MLAVKKAATDENDLSEGKSHSLRMSDPKVTTTDSVTVQKQQKKTTSKPPLAVDTNSFCSR